MALIDIWKKSREQIENKTVQQIISFAGGGKLRDGNDTSEEFRNLLSHIPSNLITHYIDQCLNEGFPDSGLVLQDLVNQIGERLGFEANFGRYRGAHGKSGFDGMWKYPDGHSLILEIKTTDAYRIDLNTLASYRQQLANQGSIEIDKSSILIVVGRQDTGDLEAQIRGSKHAWDIRLISCDSLLELLRIKEEVDDPETINRIHQILVPREFTKLDDIVRLVFSTAQDVRGDEPIDEEEIEEKTKKRVSTTGTTPVSFNDECMKLIEEYLNLSFVKRSFAKFSTPDKSVSVVCAVSKEYAKSGQKYWFGFHPHHREFLEASPQAYAAFGCGSEKQILLIPFEDFKKWIDGMNITELSDRFYWHVHISKEGSEFYLNRKKGEPTINLTPFFLA